VYKTNNITINNIRNSVFSLFYLSKLCANSYYVCVSIKGVGRMLCDVVQESGLVRSSL